MTLKGHGQNDVSAQQCFLKMKIALIDLWRVVRAKGGTEKKFLRHVEYFVEKWSRSDGCLL